MIETIEFVLGFYQNNLFILLNYKGLISSTASYLRLWALSLAHGQLARVIIFTYYCVFILLIQKKRSFLKKPLVGEFILEAF